MCKVRTGSQAHTHKAYDRRIVMNDSNVYGHISSARIKNPKKQVAHKIEELSYPEQIEQYSVGVSSLYGLRYHNTDLLEK